jgi:hypothetical protein
MTTRAHYGDSASYTATTLCRTRPPPQLLSPALPAFCRALYLSGRISASALKFIVRLPTTITVPEPFYRAATDSRQRQFEADL